MIIVVQYCLLVNWLLIEKCLFQSNTKKYLDQTPLLVETVVKDKILKYSICLLSNVTLSNLLTFKSGDYYLKLNFDCDGSSKLTIIRKLSLFFIFQNFFP